MIRQSITMVAVLAMSMSFGCGKDKEGGEGEGKAAEAAEQAGAASSGDTPEVAAPGRASQTWAMLIKRVYEIDPLACPNCGGTMKGVAFLEPPQADVIEKILRHCGLWHATRAPPAGEDLVHGPDGHSQAANDAPRELTFVADHSTWGEAAGFQCRGSVDGFVVGHMRQRRQTPRWQLG